MVNSTESIGRLIADEVLLQAERQLLRNQNSHSEKQQEQPAQSPSQPLSHNDKAVASVLLTILDEQLDHATISPQKQSADLAASQSKPGDVAGGANRIAAQYAEAESAFRPDLPNPGVSIPLNQANPQLLASSPELRMMMESAFVTAAARLQAAGGDAEDGAARMRRLAGNANAQAAIRIGAGLFVAFVLVIVIAAKLAR